MEKKAKTSKKQPKKGSHIAFLLDMTGSMAPRAQDAVGGLNTFMEEQKKVKGKANMSLYTFNSEIGVNPIFEDVELTSARDFSMEEFKANGMTPLFDSIEHVIDRVEKNSNGKNIIFAILTDGEENFSRKVTLKELYDRIQDKQKKDKWNFIFLGTNIDAYLASATIGIIKDPLVQNIVQFDNTAKGYRNMYNTVSCSTTSYRASK